MSTTIPALFLLLLTLAASAQEQATLPYATIFPVIQKFQGYLGITLRCEVAAPEPLAVVIAIPGGADEPLAIAADGGVVIPCRPELVERGALIKANRPKGTMILDATVQQRLAGAIDRGPGRYDLTAAFQELLRLRADLVELIRFVPDATAYDQALLTATAVDGKEFSLVVTATVAGREIRQERASVRGQVRIPAEAFVSANPVIITVTPPEAKVSFFTEFAKSVPAKP